MKSVRKIAKAIARGRTLDHRLIIPLAFEVAAQISARPAHEFRTDPTQLTNGPGGQINASSLAGLAAVSAAAANAAAQAGRPTSTPNAPSAFGGKYSNNIQSK
jgi:hypothetical protein